MRMRVSDSTWANAIPGGILLRMDLDPGSPFTSRMCFMARCSGAGLEGQSF